MEPRLATSADFVPPPDLLAVARTEMSVDDYQRMLELQGDQPLTGEMYVHYIETIRKEGRL